MAEPTPLIIAPFGLMLLSIALMPIIAKHHWERHYAKIAVGLGAITTFYYLFVLHSPHRMVEVAHEYISFVALIGSLYIVSGGIHIKVAGEAKPLMNCAFLLCGAVLANFIGTTGASMLLIRPWIRMNQYRITAFHVVFFIFIVSNIGGCLTPIGDPPLFLGFIKGVPFWWVFKTCWEAWLIAIGFLLVVFYFLDRRNFLRAPKTVRDAQTARESWQFTGLHNLLFLLLILGAVFIRKPAGVSEALMIVAALGSWFTTSKATHQANDFNFHPIQEVAWLFLGIFATMVPALDYLQMNAGTLGLKSEAGFFWLSGALSAALDNAPTYLTFLAVAMGRAGLSLDNPAHVRLLAEQHDHELIAISLGAVFFGAMTYIGNGPNFMVKAVAEAAKIRTPGFFAYVAQYALPILLPLFLLISLLFFSRFRVF
jgi:Na+/H+ antiporter NhaD/arsenite permease-like protein